MFADAARWLHFIISRYCPISKTSLASAAALCKAAPRTKRAMEDLRATMFGR